MFGPTQNSRRYVRHDLNALGPLTPLFILVSVHVDLIQPESLS